LEQNQERRFLRERVKKKDYFTHKITRGASIILKEKKKLKVFWFQFLFKYLEGSPWKEKACEDEEVRPRRGYYRYQGTTKGSRR